MKWKSCPGPLCRGAQQPYTEFDPNLDMADMLETMCKACTVMEKTEIDQTPKKTKTGRNRVKETAQTKTCKTCRRTKPLDEFYINNSCPLGREPHCKECSKARRAQKAGAGKTVRVKRAKPRSKKELRFVEPPKQPAGPLSPRVVPPMPTPQDAAPAGSLDYGELGQLVRIVNEGPRETDYPLIRRYIGRCLIGTLKMFITENAIG